MATNKQLNVIFAGDSSQLSQAFAKISGDAASMGNKFDAIGGKMSNFGKKMSLTVSAPLAAGGVAAFKMAADAEDATAAMNTVFGKSGKEIEKWSKNAATAMGVSSTEAKKAAVDFAIFGKAAGLTGKDLTDFSTQQSQLAADLASFSGTSTEEAITAIGAAYRGETEPIRQYGVLIDQNKIKEEAVRLGLAKGGEELSNNAKLMAIRSLVMKQTTDQQGDFARTSDSAANEMKKLSAQMKDQAAAIGTQLIPIGQQLLSFVGNLIAKFQGLSPEMQGFIVKAAGVTAAVGPVLFVGGKLVSAFDDIGRAFMGLSRIVAANPWILLIAATIALVTLIVQNWDTIKRTVADGWNWAQNVTDRFVDFLGRLPGRIGGIFGDAGRWLFDVGKDIVWGLRNGFRETWDKFTDSVANWFTRWKDWIKRILGIASPSKFTSGLGKELGRGLELGMLGSLAGVSKASRLLADAAMPDVGGAEAGNLTPRALAAAAGAAPTINVSITANGPVDQSVVREWARMIRGELLQAQSRGTTLGFSS